MPVQRKDAGVNCCGKAFLSDPKCLLLAGMIFTTANTGLYQVPLPKASNSRGVPFDSLIQ
jgi:hypothetical protein